MILVDFTRGWLSYLTSSPYLNLWRAAERDQDCVVLGRGLPDEDAKIGQHQWSAIVSDSVARSVWPQGPIRIYVENDIHRFNVEALAKARATHEQFDLVLDPYRFASLPEDLLHVPEDERASMVFFPHHVPDDPPPCQSADAAGAFVVAPGARRPYPFLHALAALNPDGVHWQAHPGYLIADMERERNAWFPTLARYRVGLVGLGWGRGGYVLAKYLEYLYAGLLLVAERPSQIECELLGLRDGMNCLLVDSPQQAADALRQVLLRSDDFASIAAAGQALALERHCARHRIAYLKSIVAHYQEHGRVPTTAEQAMMFVGGAS